jgi:uncharacterized membrane protein
MGGFIAIFLLLSLAFLVGSILGWIAFTRTSRLQRDFDELAVRLNDLERARQRAESAAARMSAAAEPRRAPAAPAASTKPLPAAPEATAPPPHAQPRSSARPSTPGFAERLFDNARRNWMAWLGGISVALAGIFLVGYSIEMGYLGPVARIALAVIAGLVLHAAAEYLRRRTGTAHPAFAAMAGGASITLYAALLAALELYDLFSPGLTFALLALVSLATMALATVHGPLLAALGLLGAYIVPLLVIDNPGDIRIYLAYSLIVTTAGLFLIRFVYRLWLWVGTLGGALFWWLMALDGTAADGYLGYYLAAVAYLALAIPTSDWSLTRRTQDGDPASEAIGPDARMPVFLATVIVFALAQFASMVNVGFTDFGTALLWWSPLTIVVLWAARSRDSLALAPWALLFAQMCAWFVDALDTRGGLPPFAGLYASSESSFLAYAIAMSALFSVGTWLTRRGRPLEHLHASLIWLAPVLWLALAYLLVTDLSSRWEWAVATLTLGLIYISVAGRRLVRDAGDSLAIWPIAGGHFAYSLAAAMYFREASLTLALAAQLISLAWLLRRFALPWLEWLIKGVLALVVLRLTFNPWMLTYPADVHWSLWTYGGAVLCCFFATRLADEKLPIRKWLEAATLHLLVLFLGAETRYWLYDGDVFAEEFTLTEAAIDTALWGGLGISYFHRSLSSAHLSVLYVLLSRVLMVLALGSYALALTALNPWFGDEPISSTPIFNIMLLAYGAPVLIAIAAWFLYETRFKPVAASIAGIGLFIVVTLEIRHLWHGALSMYLGTTSGEIYTYSAAWLVMAVATMLTATARGSRAGYQAGMALLLLVIAKIFLYDMSDLAGLLRVGSFFGLGLALLGLAWLYQRTARRPAAEA